MILRLSCKYKTKLTESKTAEFYKIQQPLGHSKSLYHLCTIKYLSIFWRLLEMSLINCKVKLKVKATKYCALASADFDNTDVDRNNIIFII